MCMELALAFLIFILATIRTSRVLYQLLPSVAAVSSESFLQPASTAAAAFAEGEVFCYLLLGLHNGTGSTSLRISERTER